ncbi:MULTISPECIES: sensor histidine kinase [unclassified Rhizobium]|uniref:sensor histidine kinase n=1 Tax=unclassified Rhizobium TaxID=2613769 RepID=UPI0009EC51BC|nr:MULTISPECIES: ATP-binding protein [unclassified Rhizobium]
MERLGLSARLMAIAFSALLVLWLLVLASYYRGNADIEPNPTPERLAALTELLSQADGAGRARLITAMEGPQLALSLQAAPEAGGLTGVGRDVTGRPDLSAYHAALGPALLSIQVSEPEGNRPRLLQFLRRNPLPLAFEIRLEDGTVLSAEARMPPGLTLYGLPVGLGAGLLGTLLALAVLLLVQREIQPLVTLARAADRMEPGGPPVPLPPTSGRNPDVRRLIQAFGRLQDRLQTLMKTRLALISGVQHDVRSFATRLRLRVEAIPDERDRSRAVKDIEDMIRLLDDALLSARGSEGSLDEELIDLVDFLKSDIGDLKRSGTPVDLHSLPAGEVPVLADRLALRRMVGNLVDNGVKYGERAKVSLGRDGRWAVICVSDEGPGIAPEDRLLLLEPFTRGEPSRARKTGGAGLGLAIVRALTEAQGGTIEIGDVNRCEQTAMDGQEAASGRGACVCIRLPLFENSYE